MVGVYRADYCELFLNTNNFECTDEDFWNVYYNHGEDFWHKSRMVVGPVVLGSERLLRREYNSLMEGRRFWFMCLTELDENDPRIEKYGTDFQDLYPLYPVTTRDDREPHIPNYSA